MYYQPAAYAGFFCAFFNAFSYKYIISIVKKELVIIKNFRFCFRCFIQAFSNIHMIDKCLIVIMALLLLQSVYSLVAGGALTAETNHIDTIIRTSAAAIFGYFLSANFTNSKTKPVAAKEDTAQRYDPPSFLKENGLQVIIATIIGIFCIVVLILVRNIPLLNERMGASSSATATVVQLRDFVSGCVGFLIGCPTDKR